jgi:GNAT superfamily N-acetyltransferase
MIDVLNYDAISKLDLKEFVFVNNRPSPDPDALFFCYFEEHKLVGILRFNVGQLVNWFSYIEVLPDFRKKGIAASLIKYLFMYCRSNRLKTISVSHFTQMGYLSVQHLLNRFSREYNIALIMDKH